MAKGWGGGHWGTQGWGETTLLLLSSQPAFGLGKLAVSGALPSFAPVITQLIGSQPVFGLGKLVMAGSQPSIGLGKLVLTGSQTAKGWGGGHWGTQGWGETLSAPSPLLAFAPVITQFIRSQSAFGLGKLVMIGAQPGIGMGKLVIIGSTSAFCLTKLVLTGFQAGYGLGKLVLTGSLPGYGMSKLVMSGSQPAFARSSPDLPVTANVVQQQYKPMHLIEVTV